MRRDMAASEWMTAADRQVTGHDRSDPALRQLTAENHRADPFVVARGRVLNGTVFTDEQPRRDQNARRKIPDACDHLHVPWRN
jgi:hypothetical protein